MRALQAPAVLLTAPLAGPRVSSRAFAEGPDVLFAAVEAAARTLKRVEIGDVAPLEGRVTVMSRPILFGARATAWAHVFEIETGETQLDVGGDRALAEKLMTATVAALSAPRRA